MMAELPTYFNDFLANIRLTQEQVSELKEAHTTLRKRLEGDEDLSKILVTTFLQGSYRRATIVRPAEGGKADVDVIVVTNLDQQSHTPQQAMGKFRNFLDTHYSGKWRYQGRSIGIGLETVDLDLVITSAPSEVAQKALRSESVRSAATLEEAPDLRFNDFWLSPEHRESLGARSWMFKALQEPEWKTEPLWIPDRDVKEWQQTHPLEQIRCTRDKNARTEGYFVNVVKALKWWRRVQDPKAEQPKSYPLERIFWECCPDSIRSVAAGVTQTLEQIAVLFKPYAAAGTVPELCDHGIPQDVLKRLSGKEFGRFYEKAEAAAVIAREAYADQDKVRSARRWRDLFGEEFPPPPEGNDSSDGSKGGGTLGGYTEREGRSSVGSGRFA
jgi:hypothetical protein